jgi:hypothetical protein
MTWGAMPARPYHTRCVGALNGMHAPSAAARASPANTTSSPRPRCSGAMRKLNLKAKNKAIYHSFISSA